MPDEPAPADDAPATLHLGIRHLVLPAAGSPLFLRRDRPFDTAAPVTSVADVLRYVAVAREVLTGPLVLEIEGPGDALASPESVLRALALVADHHPDVLTGLVIDGPLLAEFDEELVDFGLNYLALRLDAADRTAALRLVDGAIHKGELLERDAAATLMVEGTRNALTLAARAGLSVAVRTTLIPPVNGHQIQALADLAIRGGAERMDILPHVPVPGAPIAQGSAPTAEEVADAEAIARTVAEARHAEADAPTALSWLDPTRFLPVDVEALEAVDPLRVLPGVPDPADTPRGVVLPRRRAQWVAVATQDGALVDQSLQQAQVVRIYAVGEDAIEVLGVRHFAKDPRRRADGVGDARLFLRTLTGCRALVTKGFTPRASSLLRAVGMRAISSDGPVEPILDRVARGTVR